jgi:hypothetical protein
MPGLTAILEDDPPGQPASVPPALDRLVRRCLEKRPDDRFHSAHDLSLAFEVLSSGSGPISGVFDPQPASGWSRRQILAGGAGPGLLGIGLGAGTFVAGARGRRRCRRTIASRSGAVCPSSTG